MDHPGLSSAAIERREVYFAGRVQGVGFRHTAWHIAKRYRVTGYVQNLVDGRVKLIAEGVAAEVAGYLADLQGEMSRHIHSVDAISQAATGEFDQFSIRY